MMARRRVLMGMVGSLAVLLGGCARPEASYRFRMTVEVETPQGIRTGSSVLEVHVHRGMAIGDKSGISSALRGEAVVVDLPDGPLFVLLALPDAGPPLLTVVNDALLGRRSASPDEVMKDTAALGSTWFGQYHAELPRHRDTGCVPSQHCSDSNWPLMVRFRDLRDPRSVERIDPETIGVRRIKLETTNDDVTTDIANRLLWLGDLKRFREDPSNPFTNKLPAEIGYLRGHE